MEGPSEGVYEKQKHGRRYDRRSLAFGSGWTILYCIDPKYTWLRERGGSMPNSQGLSNNPYPEPNQSNSPHQISCPFFFAMVVPNY